MQAVLVTGGTGFLGGELVRQLCAQAAPVHVLARPGPALAALPRQVRVHAGNLTDEAAVDAAVAAVCADARADAPPAVIHCGAIISYRTKDESLQRAVNVGGTRHVLQACERQRVGRVVHVSSIVAVGHAARGQLLDEESPYNGEHVGCDYMTTKRAAEELALRHAERLDVVVVNPAAIFGPTERESNTTRFLRRLAQGTRLRFAPPGANSVVGVVDAAAGTLLALRSGIRGRRYILAESHLESIELFRLAAAAVAGHGPERTLSPALWRAVVLGAIVVDMVAPQELFTPQALRMLGLRFACDGARARRELGWRPVPFEQVLRETVAGLRAKGLLA